MNIGKTPDRNPEILVRIQSSQLKRNEEREMTVILDMYVLTLRRGDEVPVFDKWPSDVLPFEENTNPKIFLTQEELESGARNFFLEHPNEDVGKFMYAQISSEINDLLVAKTLKTNAEYFIENKELVSKEQAQDLDMALRECSLIAETDPVWVRWLNIGKSRGWIRDEKAEEDI